MQLPSTNKDAVKETSNGATNGDDNIHNDAEYESGQDSDNAAYQSEQEEEEEQEEQEEAPEPEEEPAPAPAPAPKKKTQAPVKKPTPNGANNSLPRERSVANREVVQQARQRLQPKTQPSLPPMHQPNPLPRKRTQPQPLVQQPYQQYPVMPPRADGYRPAAIRESRIKDRPQSSKQAGDSALKIKIELDLEVEVDLYARVKGDVTIGLM